MSGFSLFWCRFVPRSQGGLQSSVHRGTRERCGVLLPTWAGSGLQQQDVWGGGLLQPPPEVQPGLWAVQDHGQVLLLPRLESGPGRRQLPQHRWGDGAPCLYWNCAADVKIDQVAPPSWNPWLNLCSVLLKKSFLSVKRRGSFCGFLLRSHWEITENPILPVSVVIYWFMCGEKKPIYIYSNDPAVEWCEDLLSVYLQPITFHYSRVVSVKASSPNTGPKSLI